MAIEARSLVPAVRLVVFISEGYLAIFWPSIVGGFIGLTFGIVIIVWWARSVREAARFRSLAFLVASALIWILVFELMSIGIKRTGLFSASVDPLIFYGSVALGTVLLTVAHAQLLGTSWTRTLIAIPGILGIWLLAGRHLPVPNWDPVGARLAIWQGAYLLFMFGFSMPNSLHRR